MIISKKKVDELIDMVDDIDAKVQLIYSELNLPDGDIECEFSYLICNINELLDELQELKSK